MSQSLLLAQAHLEVTEELAKNRQRTLNMLSDVHRDHRANQYAAYYYVTGASITPDSLSSLRRAVLALRSARDALQEFDDMSFNELEKIVVSPTPLVRFMRHYFLLMEGIFSCPFGIHAFFSNPVTIS